MLTPGGPQRLPTSNVVGRHDQQGEETTFLRKTVTTMGAAAITSAALIASVSPAGAVSADQVHFRAPTLTQTQQQDRPVDAQNDFRVPGVRIWREPRVSIVDGLGYPGQIFDTDITDVVGGTYTCDNGVTTDIWDHGRNRATGVVGWVPICNLIF